MKKIDLKTAKINPISLIGEEWMLITAGNSLKYNMMTASWGFMGFMWNKPCVQIGVRPQRYTMEFLEKEDYFTLTFFGNNKDVHTVCGKKSGRDIDKTKECNLTPQVHSTGSIYFKEAGMVFVCKKLYMDKLKANNFIDKNLIEKNYPNDDFHNMITAEIVDAFEL